jgi:hypothetical protein
LEQYSLKVQGRAVRMAHEHRPKHPSQWVSMKAVRYGSPAEYQARCCEQAKVA